MNDVVFTVYPAIDLRAGQVVRLKEGDPNREKRYSTDPAGTALRWIEAGAGWLHVVNLDGAFGETSKANYQALQAILAEARRSGVNVQFGGGLRSLESIRGALEAGVERVVLGTVIVEQPGVLKEALNTWGPERIAAGIDARDGQVQVRGWQYATSVLALELALSLHEQGLRWLIFTDIARDGLQTGLNLPATIALARASGLQVIASGGVSRIEEIRQAKDAGLAGVIVGRALYEGAINEEQLFSKEID